MAEAIPAAPPRPPFWRDVRVRRVLGQMVFVVAVIAVLRELFLNLEFNVERQRQDLGFGFLDNQAGFPIGEGIEYSPNDPISRAFLVGLVNTIRLASVGIVLSTLVGLVMGIARLSPNWLVRRIAGVYVDVVRNTPAILQIYFLWAAVFLAIVTIENAWSLFDVAFLSNRGAAIPWFKLEDGATTWGWFVLAGLGAAAVVWIRRSRTHERTGAASHRALWSVAALLAFGLLGLFVSGTPVRANVPELVGRGYEGGIRLTPEYLAPLVALVFYTGAFIAEIVRGSIQAVHKGQREAAEALGLSRRQQLRLVVLPQALRIAIPAINSQYLNLTKNTTLAIIVGYPELAHVASSIISNRGFEAPATLLLMLTFLGMTLLISFFMNLVNRSVVGRGASR